MSIKQLNATYIPQEDRVLFRLTTHPSDEYRLWLSRARVAELLSQGEQAAIVKLQAEHPPQQAKAIAEFKQQVVQQTTPFTQFEPASRFPLGNEPILVHALRFEQQDQQQTLHLVLAGQKTLSLKLNDDLLAKLRLLLETMVDKANWGLAPKSGASPVPAPAPGGSSKHADRPDADEADPASPGGSKRLLH
ncbi:MAG: hypothetical protein EBV20_08705 [Betaproteobacteria bacterium]|jgi:hypothetical protein|nr:hypothetical protein [Betaproteobacteria bacterium]NBP46197.1 hypothetical protein [Betaproteobacteria bacterium]